MIRYNIRMESLLPPWQPLKHQAQRPLFALQQQNPKIQNIPMLPFCPVTRKLMSENHKTKRYSSSSKEPLHRDSALSSVILELVVDVDPDSVDCQFICSTDSSSAHSWVLLPPLSDQKVSHLPFSRSEPTRYSHPLNSSGTTP